MEPKINRLIFSSCIFKKNTFGATKSHGHRTIVSGETSEAGHSSLLTNVRQSAKQFGFQCGVESAPRKALKSVVFMLSNERITDFIPAVNEINICLKNILT